MGAGSIRKNQIIQILFMLACLGCSQKRKYLQSTVRNLKNIQSLRRADIADVNFINSKQNQQNLAEKRNHYENDVPPPLSLTKGELTALYEQSLSKGHTLKLDAGNDEYIHAAVHEIDDLNANTRFPDNEDEKKEEETGYYYYYYPLNSFLSDSDAHAHQVETFEEHPTHPVEHNHQNSATPVQTHWHTHQHNITITKENEKGQKHPKKFSEKLVEPLFMAVSGFLGMALMTFLTTIFLPKHNSIKNSTKPSIKKKDNSDSLDDFAKFALNALDGRCAERFACELTKTARSFNIEDNRFFKLIRRLVPGGAEMEKAKYLNQQLKCTAIPCAQKKPATEFYIDNPYFDRSNALYYPANSHYFDSNRYNNFDRNRYSSYNQNRKHNNVPEFDNMNQNRRPNQQKKHNNQKKQQKNEANQKKNQNKNNSNKNNKSKPQNNKKNNKRQ